MIGRENREDEMLKSIIFHSFIKKLVLKEKAPAHISSK